MIIVPTPHDFHARYSDIDPTAGMSDWRIELIEEGIDCAICLGQQTEIDISTIVTVSDAEVHLLFGLMVWDYFRSPACGRSRIWIQVL